MIGPPGAEVPAVMPQVYHTPGRLTWRDARGVRPGVCMYMGTGIGGRLQLTGAGDRTAVNSCELVETTQ